MEANSAGEETVVKIRKPYTITKQRERWTVEEHNRFLEALKLYGRAWQRIEEHIGTKTAVQIRSHAQKFFTKLEKEALMKGIPPGQAHDIDIPPPRPKRKPSIPYPRKTTVGFLSPTREAVNDKPSKSVSLVGSNKQILDVDTHAPQEKLAATKTFQTKAISENGSCSEVLNLFQETPSASISSVDNSSPTPCMNRELISAMREGKEKCGMDKSFVYVVANKELIKDGKTCLDEDTRGLKEICINSQPNFAQEVGANDSKLQKTVASSSKENVQSDQPDPNDAPAQFRPGSSVNYLQTTSFNGHVPTSTDEVDGHANANPFMDPTASATPKVHQNSAMPCMHQTFQAFPPFTQFHSDQDAHRSFLNNSSTFSSLIISTLLQNPAVHGAASLAASFWSSAGVDTSVDSSPEILVGGLPVRHMNPSSSMASIAAATVAAAAAWWATQGLLPLFPPHPGFAFAPAPNATVSTIDAAQAPGVMSVEKDGPFQDTTKDQQVVNLDQYDALKTYHSSKSSLSSTLDSDESGSGEPSNCTELKTSRAKLKSLSAAVLNDTDKAGSKKKLERSSCGSNTPSSSEVETDSILEKHEQGSAEARQAHFGNSSTGETANRRIRSNAGMNESWKAVSEEGRLAFQALFSREVLPQKFSPRHLEDAAAKTGEDKEVPTLPVDPNKKACGATDLSHTDGFTKVSSERISENLPTGFLTSEIGHGKLKTRRIGFKPYKRCSVEAKENRGTAAEEVGNKRIRLEGEAST